MISQKGAKKILDFVAKDGINWPVDWQLWFMRDRPIGEPGLHVYAIKDAVQPGKDGKFSMLVTHPYTFASNLGHQGIHKR